MIRCVLFIAGDVPFQAAVSPLLARRGYQVEQVGSGEEARALLARERPAFVVLDERLPEGDPLKWAAALREAGDPTPAIILSAAHSMSARSRRWQWRTAPSCRPSSWRGWRGSGTPVSPLPRKRTR